MYDIRQHKSTICRYGKSHVSEIGIKWLLVRNFNNGLNKYLQVYKSYFWNNKNYYNKFNINKITMRLFGCI